MDEYISRKYVLDKFIEGDGNDEFTEGYNFAVNEYREKIKAMPSADVQPVKYGKWECNQYLWENGLTRCSNCKDEYHIEDLKAIADYELFSDFCSNCGARMDR